MDIPNSRIANALDLLRQNPRSQVYEGAASARSTGGVGEFFVTYGGGRGPTLTRADVETMLQRGWIVRDPECSTLFNQGSQP